MFYTLPSVRNSEKNCVILIELYALLFDSNIYIFCTLSVNNYKQEV